MNTKIFKTILTFATFSIAALSFTSCQKEKDWKCNCYLNGDLASSSPIVGQKKKDAKKTCDAKEDGGRDCKLD